MNGMVHITICYRCCKLPICINVFSDSDGANESWWSLCQCKNLFCIISHVVFGALLAESFLRFGSIETDPHPNSLFSYKQINAFSHDHNGLHSISEN